jgi:hypothetical protein
MSKQNNRVPAREKAKRSHRLSNITRDKAQYIMYSPYADKAWRIENPCKVTKKDLEVRKMRRDISFLNWVKRSPRSHNKLVSAKQRRNLRRGAKE